MRLIICERGDKDRQRWRQPRLAQATHFLVKRLMPDAYQDIEIELGMRCSNNLIKGTHWGHVTFNGVTSKGVRKFDVKIQKNAPYSQVICTLAHELMHVWQFVTGRYVLQLEGSVWTATWKGESLGEKKKINYWTRPWEIEARAHQERLRDAFFAVERLADD